MYVLLLCTSGVTCIYFHLLAVVVVVGTLFFVLTYVCLDFVEVFYDEDCFNNFKYNCSTPFTNIYYFFQ